MTLSKSCIFDEKNYSYQHIHGTMLVNFNKLAFELNLSHSEYRLMGTLIGLWNKNKGMAFPTVNYLAQYCRMGKATIIKNLNHLVRLNLLIVVKSKKKRNNYYFSNLLFESKKESSIKPVNGSTCKTTHDKQIKILTTKNKSSFNQNNDAKNIIDINEHKQILDKLNNWNYSGANKLLKQKNLEEIKKLIKFVENKNPDNKGAYLRTLISTPGINDCLEIKTQNLSSDNLQIEKMLKYQYWKHVPTGNIYKVTPDIGRHLLIRYYKNEQMVEILETGLVDKLDNFELVE